MTIVALIGALYQSLVFDSARLNMAKLKTPLSPALTGLVIAGTGTTDKSPAPVEVRLVVLDTLLGIVRRCGRAAHDCMCALVQLAVGPNAHQLRATHLHGRHPQPVNPPSIHSHTIASQVR